jgi:hypothetical protein
LEVRAAGREIGSERRGKRDWKGGEGGEIGKGMRGRRDWKREDRSGGGGEIARGRRDWKGEESLGEGGELYLVTSEFPHYSRRWLV